MTAEKVYVIGGTGNIGVQVVQGLLAKNVATTIFVRSPEKAWTLFNNSKNLTFVEGDYSNMEKFKATVIGHTRLFLLVASFEDMPGIKASFAKFAYEAGVQQVVQISSQSVSSGWRQSFIGTEHRLAEEAIFNLPNRAAHVTLRPSAFFTNHFVANDKQIKFKNIICSSMNEDQKVPFISTNDIALAAINILTEPIEKHRDAVYEMTSELLSGKDRAAIFSRVLGKDITFVQIPVEDEYKNYMELARMPHVLAYCILDLPMGHSLSTGLPLLLGRKTETLEQWVTENKSKFC